MTFLKKNLVFAVFLLMAAWISSVPALSQDQGQATERFLKAVSKAEAKLSKAKADKLAKLEENPAYRSVQLIQVGNLATLQKRGALRFSIPGSNKKLIANATRVEARSEGNYTWNGNLQNADGEVTIISENDEVFARIRVGREIYEVQSLGEKKNVLVLINNEQTGEECATGDVMEQKSEPSQQRMGAMMPTGTSDIRVLVLYTSSAQNAVSSVSNTASLAISQANTASYNSKINGSLRFTLAGTRYLNFGETSDIVNDRDNLVVNTTARSLRDQYEADLVILLTDGNYGGGYIYGIAKGIEVSSENAYAIVEADKATGSFTLVHEMAHLIGARHQQCDIFLNNGCDNTAGSAHGYAFKTGVWPFRTDRITIMHQLNGESRVQHFSNPNAEYSGKSTGSSSNNNASKLSSRASTVAAFRYTPLPMSVSISGPSKGDNAGTYTWNAYVSNGASPYSYKWEYSYDGYSYNGTLGYTQSITAPLPYDEDLHLKLTVTDNSGATATAYFMTLNMDKGFVFEDPHMETQTTDNLLTIYPNPAVKQAKLAYTLESKQQVRINLLDQRGQEVLMIYEGEQAEGAQSVEVNTQKLKKGIYYCRIQTESGVITEELVIGEAK